MVIPFEPVFRGEWIIEQLALVADKVAIFDVVPPEGQLTGSIDRFGGFVRRIQLPEAFLDPLGKVVNGRRALGGPVGTDDGRWIKLREKYFRDAHGRALIRHKLGKGRGIKVAGDQWMNRANLIIEIVLGGKFSGQFALVQNKNLSIPGR